MTKQPVALRLADEMSKYRITDESVLQTATELRRLHGVNQELLEALNKCVRHGSGLMSDDPRSYLPLTILNNAKAAIIKATGEQA